MSRNRKACQYIHTLTLHSAGSYTIVENIKPTHIDKAVMVDYYGRDGQPAIKTGN